MIALHFRDSPTDVLRKTSIFCTGLRTHFGGLPFPTGRDPPLKTEGTDAHRTSIKLLF